MRAVILDGFGVDPTDLRSARFRITGPRIDGATPGPETRPTRLHDNLPELAQGEGHPIPDAVGRFILAVKPFENPPPPLRIIRDRKDFGASRRLVRVGLVVVLMEEDDSPTDGSVQETVGNLDRELEATLNAELRGALLDWTQPRPDNATPPTLTDVLAPFDDAFHQRLFEHAARVGRSIRAQANWPLNPDDQLGSFVRVFTYDEFIRIGIFGTADSRPLGGHDIGYSVHFP